MDNVTFGCNGPYGDVWSGVAIPGQSPMFMDALLLIGILTLLSRRRRPSGVANS